MTQRKAAKGLDFETLRLAIERCDPDLVLGFYADDAQVSIVNAGALRGFPFELRGKAEIAKHLRAAFGQGDGSPRRAGGYRRGAGVTFRETCEYPDGSRIVVETTLDVRRGKISFVRWTWWQGTHRRIAWKRSALEWRSERK